MAESVLFATIFLAGLAAGSFLNVVIYRGPAMWGLVDGAERGDLVSPRSYCPECRSTLTVADLVPIASYVARRGRCSVCGATIPLRYPVVEALGGASALLAVMVFGWTPAAFLAALFAFALIVLAFIDAETGYLPDAITWPLGVLGLCANAAEAFVPFSQASFGALAGFVFFYFVGEIYEGIRGKEGLGLGDAKLLAAIGAWTGWIYLPVVVLIAALGTLSVIAFRRGVKKDDAVPFGPGLCAAGFLALFFGDRLLNAL